MLSEIHTDGQQVSEYLKAVDLLVGDDQGQEKMLKLMYVFGMKDLEENIE